MRNKKGNILDWILITIVLFLIGISIFLAYMLIDVTDTTGVFDDYPEASNVMTKGKEAILTGDNMFLFIIVGLSIFVIIGAAIVYNHPAFFILGFFALAISLVFAAIISNAFWAFHTSGEIATAASNFPKILFLMNNLPFYLVFMGLSGLIASIVGYRKQ